MDGRWWLEYRRMKRKIAQDRKTSSYDTTHMYNPNKPPKSHNPPPPHTSSSHNYRKKSLRPALVAPKLVMALPSTARATNQFSPRKLKRNLRAWVHWSCSSSSLVDCRIQTSCCVERVFNRQSNRSVGSRNWLGLSEFKHVSHQAPETVSPRNCCRDRASDPNSKNPMADPGSCQRQEKWQCPRTHWEGN